MKALEIKNQTETQSDLYIYGDIVSSEWDRWQMEDVAPEGIRTFLDQIKGKDLNIFLNSGGGSVFAGISIAQMIKRHRDQGNNVTITVDGVAASIASIIAFSGTKLVMSKSAFLMIHKPWTSMAGNSNDLRKMASDLDRIEEGILNVYAENLKDGVDMATIKSMVTKETWLNGVEAAKYFNIEVAESSKAVACTSDFFKNYSDMPSEVIQEMIDDASEEVIEAKQEEEHEEVIEKVSNTQKIDDMSQVDDLLLQIDLL